MSEAPTTPSSRSTNSEALAVGYRQKLGNGEISKEAFQSQDALEHMRMTLGNLEKNIFREEATCNNKVFQEEAARNNRIIGHTRSACLDILCRFGKELVDDCYQELWPSSSEAPSSKPVCVDKASDCQLSPALTPKSLNSPRQEALQAQNFDRDSPQPECIDLTIYEDTPPTTRQTTQSPTRDIEDTQFQQPQTELNEAQPQSEDLASTIRSILQLPREEPPQQHLQPANASDQPERDLDRATNIANDDTVHTVSTHNVSSNNDTAQNDTAQNDTAQNDTAQNDTAQNDTAQNDTVQNDTAHNVSGNNVSGNNVSGNNVSGNNVSVNRTISSSDFSNNESENDDSVHSDDADTATVTQGTLRALSLPQSPQTRRPRSPELDSGGHKRRRLEPTTTQDGYLLERVTVSTEKCLQGAVEYKHVFQEGKAAKKYIIHHLRGHWYIFKCSKCPVDFKKRKIRIVSQHLSICNPQVSDKNDRNALQHYGIRVLDCDEDLAEQNNAVARQYFDSPPDTPLNGIYNPIMGHIYVSGSVGMLFVGLMPRKYGFEQTEGWYNQLMSNIPECYDYAETGGRKVPKGWKLGFGDGGRRVSEREFMMLTLDGSKIARRGNVSWVKGKNLRPFNMRDTYLNNKPSVRKYVEELQDQGLIEIDEHGNPHYRLLSIAPPNGPSSESMTRTGPPTTIAPTTTAPAAIASTTVPPTAASPTTGPPVTSPPATQPQSPTGPVRVTKPTANRNSNNNAHAAVEQTPRPTQRRGSSQRRPAALNATPHWRNAPLPPTPGALPATSSIGARPADTSVNSSWRAINTQTHAPVTTPTSQANGNPIPASMPIQPPNQRLSGPNGELIDGLEDDSGDLEILWERPRRVEQPNTLTSPNTSSVAPPNTARPVLPGVAYMTTPGGLPPASLGTASATAPMSNMPSAAQLLAGFDRRADPLAPSPSQPTMPFPMMLDNANVTYQGVNNGYSQLHPGNQQRPVAAMNPNNLQTSAVAQGGPMQLPAMDPRSFYRSTFNAQESIAMAPQQQQVLVTVAPNQGMSMDPAGGFIWICYFCSRRFQNETEKLVHERSHPQARIQRV